jgi:tetratricopeptide (TPR) repeat protein
MAPPWLTLAGLLLAFARGASHDPYDLVESGMELAQRGDLGAAISALELALNIGRTVFRTQEQAQVMFNLALVHQNAGHLQAALEIYDSAAQLSPDLEDAWVKAAWCARELGSLGLAGGYLKNAVKASRGQNPRTLGYYGDVLNNLVSGFRMLLYWQD